MIKEILIAGLLGSVSSIDNHHNTQYLNNTVYEDLKCNGCKSLNLEDHSFLLYITYPYEQHHGKYTYMDMFLTFYKTVVVEPFEEMILKDKSVNFEEHARRDNLVSRISNLENKIDTILSDQKIHEYKYTRYNSFKLNTDGLLIYDNVV